MSTYKDETWIDKTLALAVIALPAGIYAMPTPNVDLESVALAVFAVLAGLGVLFVLRSGGLVNVLLTKCKVHWVVAASAALGAVLSKGEWLPSALAWALIGAGAWLALLLTLIVCRAVACVVLWPVLWLARRFSFESDPVQRGSYASPAPRRYTAPAGYSAARVAGVGAGAAGIAAWGDMHDPMNAAHAQLHAQMLAQMQEPVRMFPVVNPTTGATMSADSPIDDTGHIYCDPTPVYDYTPSYDYGSSNNCGGGFDF